MTDPLAFPVALEAADEVQVAGRRWFRRPEFHVTTFNPEDLAAATGLAAQLLADLGEQLHDELTAARSIRFDGRVSVATHADGRATLVAFCDVDGLEETYEQLSSRAGCELPRPPTHVTLYTVQPAMGGIGLSTQADVERQTVALPAADAKKVLAAVRRP